MKFEKGCKVRCIAPVGERAKYFTSRSGKLSLYGAWNRGEERLVVEVNEDLGLIRFNGDNTEWHFMADWEVIDDAPKVGNIFTTADGLKSIIIDVTKNEDYNVLLWVSRPLGEYRLRNTMFNVNTRCHSMEHVLETICDEINCDYKEVINTINKTVRVKK